ncbi:MAG TPA: ferritin-like domain-containing protein [Anaeromyxobacteraceae bacterium]|nr:ferritin-like domain-containing protein [Anaeromyxobacteraceae bacterium]
MSGATSRIAGGAWRFRWKVELEAAARFARLADRLEQLEVPASLVELARRASLDERRHAALCARMAARYGDVPEEPGPSEPGEIAPGHLTQRERVLYEVVAACCVTETESMGVLAELLGRARDAELRRVLHELATDEVRHSRLGWALLAAEHARGGTAFLGPLVPAMLEGCIDAGLFRPAEAELEDHALPEHGVLPHALKREVFTRTLEEVVLPGLERFGVDPAPARAWLEGKRAILATATARLAR